MSKFMYCTAAAVLAVCVSRIAIADDRLNHSFNAPDAGCSSHLPKGSYALQCRGDVWVKVAPNDAGAPINDDVLIPNNKLYDITVSDLANPHICVRMIDGGVARCSVFNRL